MAETLNNIIARKKRLVQWAGILFALGTVMLAVLIVSLIWNAEAGDCKEMRKLNATFLANKLSNELSFCIFHSHR